MGFILDFESNFMTVLKHRSHTDAGTQRYISTSETVPCDSFMGWLTVGPVFSTTSVNKTFLFIFSEHLNLLVYI